MVPGGNVRLFDARNWGMYLDMCFGWVGGWGCVCCASLIERDGMAEGKVVRLGLVWFVCLLSSVVVFDQVEILCVRLE